MHAVTVPWKPALSAAERRRERRYPTHDPAQIEILESGLQRATGTVTDVSRSGLRLELPIRIHKSTPIKVRLPHLVVFGEVVHCRSIAEGFTAGVLIQQACYPKDLETQHIEDDESVLYAAGKGLTSVEFIRIWHHLSECPLCQKRVALAQEFVRHAYRSPKGMNAGLSAISTAGVLSRGRNNGARLS